MLIGLPAQELPQHWSVVAPMLQRALSKSQGDLRLEDLYTKIFERDMQLWGWLIEGEITACCVTQVLTFPGNKICSIPFIAGCGMKDWIHVEPQLVAWAKEQGCNQLEGYCRPGWVRMLRHWKQVWITMRRDI